MKKTALILLVACMTTLTVTAQNRFGVALGGSYGKTASFSVGFTSQRVAGPIGFNVDFKGPSEYQYESNVAGIQDLYKPTTLKYSLLAGLNANIKRFTITANGGLSILGKKEYNGKIVGQESDQNIMPCFEGLLGYNIVEKEKYAISLRAGYNNMYGGLLNLGFLF